MNEGYKKFIESRLELVDKEGRDVPFRLNKIQDRFLTQDCTGRDIILKARQQGFSSLCLARYTADFILKPNSVNVVVADESENAESLLDRVKGYIAAYEYQTGKKVPLKYNSKSSLVNEMMNSKYTIGTAKNTEFGRSKTITNLHLSEAAFYPHFEKLLAGALQAVTPNGSVVIETTANGYNEFKTFWDDAKRGGNGFNPLFYKASDFYLPEFLEAKKRELKRLFKQEYPETDVEAFLTSGDSYFDMQALMSYMETMKDRMPLEQGIYAL